MQVALAHELQRPVSIHCVRAVGKVYEVLEQAKKTKTLPPAVVCMTLYRIM